VAGLKSFLSAVGHGFVDVFKWLGSKQGQETVNSAEVLAAGIGTVIGGPGVGAAIVGVETLVNAGLKQIIAVEAGAAAVGAQSGTGAQKASAVIAYLTPQAHDTLVALGVKEPTAEQVQSFATAISDGLVGILNAIPAPAVQ
jgi:hypothetical protein